MTGQDAVLESTGETFAEVEAQRAGRDADDPSRREAQDGDRDLSDQSRRVAMSASKPPKRAPTGDYPVGYAKPPKATQFQPKQSGNPSGRPKGRPSLNEIILEEAARIAKVKVGDKVLHIDKDRALMRRLFDLGLHGNVPALRFAMRPPGSGASGAQRDGRPRGAVDRGGTGGPQHPLEDDQGK